MNNKGGKKSISFQGLIKRSNVINSVKNKVKILHTLKSNFSVKISQNQ